MNGELIATDSPAAVPVHVGVQELVHNRAVQTVLAITPALVLLAKALLATRSGESRH